MLAVQSMWLYLQVMLIQQQTNILSAFHSETKITYIGEDQYLLKKGQSISFIADKPHSYHNIGTVLVEAHMTVHYNF